MRNDGVPDKSTRGPMVLIKIPRKGRVCVHYDDRLIVKVLAALPGGIEFGGNHYPLPLLWPLEFRTSDPGFSVRITEFVTKVLEDRNRPR